MAKWTVALFGHLKPKVFGWEKRAAPGDIVTFKLFGIDWTNLEKAEFLIVTIDGPTRSQMRALCETYFDLNSYKIYNPMDFNSWYAMMAVKVDLDLLEENKLQWYDEYIATTKDKCRFPKLRYQCRRFNISISDLKALGVDDVKMLDKTLLYSPVLRDIVKTECYDKLNNRYVLLSDILNEIQPLSDEDLKVP